MLPQDMWTRAPRKRCATKTPPDAARKRPATRDTAATPSNTKETPAQSAASSSHKACAAGMQEHREGGEEEERVCDPVVDPETFTPPKCKQEGRGGSKQNKQQAGIKRSKSSDALDGQSPPAKKAGSHKNIENATELGKVQQPKRPRLTAVKRSQSSADLGDVATPKTSKVKKTAAKSKPKPAAKPAPEPAAKPAPAPKPPPRPPTIPTYDEIVASFDQMEPWLFVCRSFWYIYIFFYQRYNIYIYIYLYIYI